MPRRAICPECGATATLDDNSPRREVKCAQCGTIVPIPGAAPGAANGREEPDSDAGFEIIDDGGDDDSAEHDSRPAVGRRSRSDDDDDDRPRRRRDDDDDRPRGRRREDDDDDDDEDERPRRRRDDDDEDEDDRPRSRRRDDDEDDDRPRSRRRDADEDDEDDRPRRSARDDDDEVAKDEDAADDEAPAGTRRFRYTATTDAEGRTRRPWPKDDDDDQDEDDEDDRPRRSPVKGKSKSPLPLVIGLLAFLVVGIGGGAVAYYLWSQDDDSVVLNDNPDGPGDPGIPLDPNGNNVPPVDPKPIDPKPIDPKPVDPKPVDSKSKEPKPVDPKPVDPKPIDPKPVDPKPIDSKSKEPKKKTPVPSDSRLVTTVAARLPITAAELEGAQTEVALPGPIRDVCVGGGGRFLIFHCPTARKLAVFDVSSLKVVRTITVTVDEVLFAASMEKLAVIYPDEKLVIRYSLASFRHETDSVLEVRQKPTAAAMGSATAGPLILGGIPAQGNASKMSLMFLDLETLMEVPITRTEGDFKVTFSVAAHLRASADGRTLGAWFTQLQPSGLQTARLEGNMIRGSYRPDVVGHVAPGADGQTIFTEKGQFTATAEPLPRKEMSVPAVHGNAFLTVTEIPTSENSKVEPGARRVSVWESGGNSPVATFDQLPGFDGKRDPFERDNPTLALDRRLFLVPEARILVVVPPAADKLHVYKLGPPAGEPKKKQGS